MKYEKIGAECQREAGAVHKLAPSRGTPREERAKINTTIRAKLPELSNGAIILLVCVYHHQLSLKELRRRFKEKLFVDLGELFEFMEVVLDNSSQGVATKELIASIESRIWELGPTISREEVMELVNAFRGQQVINRSYALAILLASRARDDTKDLLEMIEKSNCGLVIPVPVAPSRAHIELYRMQKQKETRWRDL